MTHEELMAAEQARHEERMALLEEFIKKVNESLDFARAQIETAYKRGWNDGYKEAMKAMMS